VGDALAIIDGAVTEHGTDRPDIDVEQILRDAASSDDVRLRNASWLACSRALRGGLITHDQVERIDELISQADELMFSR
jgi:hypothetical protein